CRSTPSSPRATTSRASPRMVSVSHPRISFPASADPSARSCRTFAALLRLLVRRDAGRLVIIGWIELGMVAAPGGVLEDAVDFAQPRRRQPQRHHLADSHHHIPAHDLDAFGRESLVISLALQLRVELA